MENNLVIKANNLNESRYRLSVQEQRVVLTMISLIKESDIDFKTYGFSIKEFAKLTGVKGKGIYSELRKVTKSLLSKTFTIKTSASSLQIGWVSSAEYYTQDGRVEFSFDPKLKPYLLALKKEFTRYQLKNVIRLKSSYSVRIYELLKQYQSIGTRFFTIEELRALLNIPDDKLNVYSNFRVTVIEKAKKELVKTDIFFDYKPVKTSRRVTGIEFIISKNNSVIKKSYKKKTDKKVLAETQIELDFEAKKTADLNRQLNKLKKLNADLYSDLEKLASKKLTKKEQRLPGSNLTIRFKMAHLLPNFLKKNKITIT